MGSNDWMRHEISQPESQSRACVLTLPLNIVCRTMTLFIISMLASYRYTIPKACQITTNCLRSRVILRLKVKRTPPCLHVAEISGISAKGLQVVLLFCPTHPRGDVKACWAVCTCNIEGLVCSKTSGQDRGWSSSLSVFGHEIQGSVVWQAVLQLREEKSAYCLKV